MGAYSSRPVEDFHDLKGRKIQVVGHAGAGKSVFSERLGKILNVPVTHLDPIFWLGTWEKANTQTAQNTVRERVSTESWIIDGNQYVPLKDITYPIATDILWVDPPFIVWFYRLMSRAVMESFRTPGRFYKDFLNYKTSIIVQAFRLRAKKIRNWERMIQKDARCCRIRDSEGFLAYLAARQVKNA